ncbi:MAG: type II toxin-antitoxin system RelB/DinJ family antitoxin [Candidatus Peribacteria bacterium]|jgi:antitoxin component of RelBE/YafQ-DinJ toxin-antitoxin module|nr:type II toxin-antitoxin system RelB/DinJ family antitoxin [Candidatus Peribacteria bacterium]
MATMILNLEEDLKKAFTELANSLGTTPSNLARMLLKNAINTKEVSFKVMHIPNILELETLTKEEYQLLTNSKKLQKTSDKFDKLISKYQKENENYSHFLLT